MDPKQQPPKRMSDIGPRRSMDMRPPSRPAQPQPQPQAQPNVVAPQPVARPVTPQPQPRPVAQPQAKAERPVPAAKEPKAPKAKRSGGWRIVLQFIVGLLVIAGVAAAIVYLYLKYYS